LVQYPDRSATKPTDICYEAGYELLHVLGMGAEPADVPLPIPVDVARARLRHPQPEGSLALPGWPG